MKFKKILIAGIAVLGLASISGVSANASSYFSRDISEAERSSTKYAKRSMDLERLSHGSVFAYIHQTGHKWIHRGEAIKVAPFYHMGHDGFIVHIPGNSGIYYAPTNSYSWYNVKKYRWIKVRRTKTVDGKGNLISGKSKFKRTNNKKALKKSGFEDFHNNLAFIDKYAPTDKRARIPYKFNPYKHSLWNVFSKNDLSNNGWWWNKRSKRWVTSDTAPRKIHYTKWIKVAF